MTPAQLTRLAIVLAQVSLARAVESVSQWCERNVIFDEPKCKGPLSLAGREYLREPLDNFGNDEVMDQICCMATRTGKTRIFYGGMAWVICNEPSRILFVKPKTQGAAGARDDARSRFIPMIRASPLLAEKIPTGQRRFEFSTAQQIIGGTIIDWAGSNSVGALASNPCPHVLQDEIDKFNSTRRRDESGKVVEADASSLADERAKEFSNPKRFKASTPTLEKGRTWQELLKSDFRRYFMPCPHCSKDVLFAWSKDYTVIAKTGCEAYVRWSDDARNADGTWDLDKVEATAHAECPHCQGHILDTHKAEMVRAGRWVATRKSNRRGYHLPAMYSAHRACNFGAMARRFLEAKHSIEGVQNFINSDLAEPYAAQGVSVNRVGLAASHIEVTGEWLKIISVDYQQKAPYLWALCRAWNGSDQSHGIEYRPMNVWSELDDFQREHSVIPQAVIIDVGFSQAEVLRECAAINMPTRCSLGESVQDALPECIGWNPAKAFGGKQMYKDEATGMWLPYRLKKDVDPYSGTELAHKMRIELLEWRSDLFEDMLDNIRREKTGLKWGIEPKMDTEEYHKHMAGKVRKPSKNNPRDYKWETVSTNFPDHLHVCETMSLLLAYRLQLISFSAIQTKKEEQEKA